MQKMNEYSKMVAALVKPGQDIIDALTPEKADLLHMAVGVSGEIAELCDACDTVNAIEEIGDAGFYIERIYQLTGVQRSIIFTEKLMVVVAGDLLDHVKKHVIYGKELDVSAIGMSLGYLQYHLAAACAEMDVTVESVKAANMAKLQVRYGKKYSNEAAIARADKNDAPR